MFDYDHDEVYDGPGICRETDHICVMDYGEVCAVWEQEKSEIIASEGCNIM